MSSVVLDASALLAYVRGERGADDGSAKDPPDPADTLGIVRIALALVAAVLALAAAACGGSDSSEPAASTGATGESAAAPCTKEAIAEGAKPSFDGQPVKVLDGFVCEGGWAAGPILVGPDGSEEQIEAAFLVKDENGKWVVPSTLPCDDSSVPEKVLDTSPCRVS